MYRKCVYLHLAKKRKRYDVVIIEYILCVRRIASIVRAWNLTDGEINGVVLLLVVKIE